MQLDKYELKSDNHFSTFYFLSVGPKGTIKKLIQFSLIDESSLYNLSLCDIDPLTGKLDDKVVTDNGDTEKVLATIAAAIYSFCEYFSEAWVYATGSTLSRTRLYRMGINKYYNEASADFKIFGETVNGWEYYIKGKNYEGFAVQRKNINLEYEKYK